jgi:FAD/FMN-containing dehydrogenase
MDKILKVNDEFHYAVVEPGVAFIDLYKHCVEHNKKTWPSTPSLGWGSVIGNVGAPSSPPTRPSTMLTADALPGRSSTAAWASA